MSLGCPILLLVGQDNKNTDHSQPCLLHCQFSLEPCRFVLMSEFRLIGIKPTGDGVLQKCRLGPCSKILRRTVQWVPGGQTRRSTARRDTAYIPRSSSRPWSCHSNHLGRPAGSCCQLGRSDPGIGTEIKSPTNSLRHAFGPQPETAGRLDGGWLLLKA